MKRIIDVTTGKVLAELHTSMQMTKDEAIELVGGFAKEPGPEGEVVMFNGEYYDWWDVDLVDDDDDR